MSHVIMCGGVVMPYKAMHSCGHPGCPEIVLSGQKYCEKHRAEHKSEDIRPGRKNGNLYSTKRWQVLRRQALMAHPICQICGKAIADTVDHVTPHRGNTDLFFDPGNLQALCKRCHDRKTWTEDGNPEYKY